MSSKDTFGTDRLVDTREAATMLSKHPAVLADWRHQNRGPKYVKFGRSIRYRVGDLRAWIADHTVKPTESDFSDLDDHHTTARRR
jgi:predicted DNA-binding transcriptional regulator AlpA